MVSFKENYMSIVEIINWIYSFQQEREVLLIDKKLNYHSDVLLKKDENGLFLKLNTPFYKSINDKDNSIYIKDEALIIKVNYFIEQFNLGDFTSKVFKMYNFQSENFNVNDLKYHSYYSKFKGGFLLDFINNNDQEFNIRLDDYQFDISTSSFYGIKGDFLLIKTNNKIDYKKFKHYVNNIIVAIGFFKGRFFKNEEYYFQSENELINSENIIQENNVDFFYRSNIKNFSFPCPITNIPNIFKIHIEISEENELKWSSRIDESVFENLVTLLIDRPRIYSAIKIVFDYYSLGQTSRVSLMFVVLETVCEEFIEEKVKIETRSIKGEASKVLSRVKEIIPLDDYHILEDAVEKVDDDFLLINKNFERVSKLMNISFNNEEKGILKKRNDFFHGRIIPRKNEIILEEDWYELEDKYDYYSYRLYVLVSKLILKKIMFSGYFINYPKILENRFNLKLKESCFSKI